MDMDSTQPQCPTQKRLIGLLQALTQPNRTQQQQQEQRKRRVAFSTVVTVVRTQDQTTDEQLRRQWYSVAELSSFKTDTKLLIKRQRRRSSEKFQRINTVTSDEETQTDGDTDDGKNFPAPQHVDVSDWDFDSVRGLECTAVPRMKRKIMSIKCIMSAYRRGLKDETVAMVARNCNLWAAHVAFVTACHDFCHAYEQEGVLYSTMPSIPETPPAFPYPMKSSSSKKRSSLSSVSSDSGVVDTTARRRVRCRST